ncbi:MAG: hypothetical protein ACQEQT_07125, partial [Chloroflexota bacterium]
EADTSDGNRTFVLLYYGARTLSKTMKGREVDASSYVAYRGDEADALAVRQSKCFVVDRT